MNAIFWLLGNILGIIEIPFQNTAQRSLFKYISLIGAIVIIPVKLCFIPFKLGYKLIFKQREFSGGIAHFTNSVIWMSLASLILVPIMRVFVPEFFDKLVSLPVPGGFVAEKLQYPLHMFDSWILHIVDVASMDGGSLAGIFKALPFVFVIACAAALWLMYGFFVFGVSQVPILAVIWIVLVLIAIGENIYLANNYDSYWVAELWHEFVMLDLGFIKHEFLDWVQFIIYYIPVVNVIAYRMWMREDKAHNHYMTKPNDIDWAHSHFYGKNKIFSYFVR